MYLPQTLVIALSTLAISACGDTATLAIVDGTGSQPVLPAPNKTLLPTVHVAKAVGWAKEAKPTAAAGLQVQAFAQGLSHPRWLYTLPNGDVLVAETNAPAKPSSGNGIRAWITGKVMAYAGASTPTANRITLLRDSDQDGVAETRSVFLQGLHSPFGMVLIGQDFYVANTDSVMHYRYAPDQTEITSAGTKLVDLPAGDVNYHWTKNLIASQDGSKLLVTVGSNSNIAERGLAEETGRAAIWEVDRMSGQYRIFASGLRNPNGMAWVPSSNSATGSSLWVAVNERDEIGSDLVPDYMTSVQDGGFYGWPYSYYGQHVDTRVKPQNPSLVASALVPDFALGPHTASLGLAYSSNNALPAAYQTGMFIGQHGSWNRQPFSGYQVIFVPFNGSTPVGPPMAVLTDFLNSNGQAQGRPVGVALDQQGALLVADDVGNSIWRVTSSQTPVY